MKRVIMIGGGHAHQLVLASFARRPLAGAKIELVDPEPLAVYSGLMPRHLSGRAAFPAIDLAGLARAAGARLRIGRVRALDPQAGTIELLEGAQLSADIISLNVGSTEPFALAGSADPALVRVRPWSSFRTRLDARCGRPGDIVVVGGGAAGVELALALAGRWPGRALRLLTGPEGLLPAFPARMGKLAQRHLELAGVDIRFGGVGTCLDGGVLRLADGARLEVAAVVPAFPGRAPAFLKDAGLPIDPNGRVLVKPDFSVEGHPDLFAVGDCAHLLPRPLPPSGASAVRSAPTLAANLRAAVAGRRTRAFAPSRDQLVLIATPDGGAIASRNGIVLAGGLFGHLKDWIDNRHVARLQSLANRATAAGNSSK